MTIFFKHGQTGDRRLLGKAYLAGNSDTEILGMVFGAV